MIIGDPAVLSREQVWNELLHYIEDGGGWRGAEFALPVLDQSETSWEDIDGQESWISDFQDSLVLSQDGDGGDVPFREDE